MQQLAECSSGGDPAGDVHGVPRLVHLGLCCLHLLAHLHRDRPQSLPELPPGLSRLGLACVLCVVLYDPYSSCGILVIKSLTEINLQIDIINSTCS